MNRRRFLSVALGAPLLAGLYTWRVEPTWLEQVHRDLPIANLPPALAGRTLVQLSDIHIGAQVDDDFVRRSFATVQALSPDFVVHTGDLVTYAGPRTLEHAAPLLEHFPRGRLGTVAILGNHDYGQQWADPRVANRISILLHNAGCTVLRNRVQDFSGLKIVGCDDLWTHHFAPTPALRSLQPTDAALVLCHNPDACDRDGWAGYQGWILAGHTHGGQCKPPFLPPPILPVGNRRYTAGEFALSGNRRLYINRGLGHLLRVRFNVRPEITIFTLRPA